MGIKSRFHTLKLRQYALWTLLGVCVKYQGLKLSMQGAVENALLRVPQALEGPPKVASL